MDRNKNIKVVIKINKFTTKVLLPELEGKIGYKLFKGKAQLTIMVKKVIGLFELNISNTFKCTARYCTSVTKIISE